MTYHLEHKEPIIKKKKLCFSRIGKYFIVLALRTSCKECTRKQKYKHTAFLSFRDSKRSILIMFRLQIPLYSKKKIEQLD